MSATRLIDPTFLFRFDVPLREADLRWEKSGLSLAEACRVPPLGKLGDRPHFADVRIAWSNSGIGFTVTTDGKEQLPWCRESRLEDSDGMHLWIDTRCSPGIHRANRNCHRFVFLPMGGGVRRDEAVAGLVPINRARESPRPVERAGLKVYGKLTSAGYRLSGLLPAASLTGFDPAEQPQIGMWFAVIDRELGTQPLTLGDEYPVAEDPSLWVTATLERSKSNRS